MFPSAEDSSAGRNKGKINSRKGITTTSISSMSKGDRHLWLIFSLLFFALVWEAAMYSQNIKDVSREIANVKTIVRVQAWQEKVEGVEDEKVAGWREYQDKYLGFSVKYPANWAQPRKEKISGKGKITSWKVSFRNNLDTSSDSKGFDVVFYQGISYLNSERSNEITAKEDGDRNSEECGDIVEPAIIGGNYSGYRVAIDKDNECLREAYFFSLSRNGNLYNIIPYPEKGIGYAGYDSERKTNEKLKVFYDTLASFRFIGRIVPVKKAIPRITAPKPMAKVKKMNGKRVCVKKNDKPRKSKTHKKKHMDMECCLDPDEIPNPWCTY